MKSSFMYFFKVLINFIEINKQLQFDIINFFYIYYSFCLKKSQYLFIFVYGEIVQKGILLDVDYELLINLKFLMWFCKIVIGVFIIMNLNNS